MDPGGTQTPDSGRTAGRGLVAIAASIVILAGLHFASSLVSLVVLSVLVALLLDPLRQRITASGRPAWLGLTTVIVVYVAVLLVVAAIVVVGLVGLLADLETYRTGLEVGLAPILGSAGVATDVATDAADVVRELAVATAPALAIIGYSVIIVAYLLLEAPHASDRLRWAFDVGPGVVERGSTLGGRLRRYVIARGVLGLVAAVLDTVVLLVLGVPSALLWGVFSFLMSFVPNIGFIVALVPPTLLALATGGIGTAILVVIAYSIINVAIDYLVQPRYIGSEVDLSPLIVTVSLIFWTLILGGAGAILAVPLTIAFVELAGGFTDARPIARLMANAVPAAPGRLSTGASATKEPEAP